MNEFEEAIENCPYSTDWNKQRQYIVSTIEGFHGDMTYCQTLRTTGEKDYSVLIVFQVYDSIYLYVQAFENGLIESAQLEKVINFDEGISFVMYSNVENASRFFPIVKRSLETQNIFYPVDDPFNIE